MHSKTFTGLFVLIALAQAACTGGRRPAAPAPAPVIAEAAPPPADTVQPLGEGFALEGRRPAGIGADLLGTAEYDLPVVANEWVRMELEFLVNQRHAVVAGWLERADRYDEWVRDVFASYGVPRDLHHLGMVESGYRPTVRSHAGAVGMWQFMPATGRGMGLRIDSLVDERMDPVRATHAAARHLRQLHREFRGDWALAAAAYNAGSGRINRGLARFNANNFWDLAQRGDLAQETRHYVPRLFAVAIIAKDPTRFGYRAPSGPGQRFSYDSIRVDLATPLTVLAQAGNLPVQQLVDLNPHMLRQVAPANYWVWVPSGQGTPLQQAYASSEFRRRGGYAYYRVREGDSLQRLADLSGLSPDRIRSLNLSAPVEPLRPGARLRLYADAARVLNARPVERVARRESSESERSSSRSESNRSTESASSRSASRSESRSSDGERSASAERGTRSSERAASSTSSSRNSASAREERGSERPASSSSARRSESSESRSASTGSRAERSSSSESRAERSSSGSSRTASQSTVARSGGSSSGSGSAARTHTVEDGESLWGIARKYDVSVEAVREANEMDGETIRPGQTLQIPRASSTAPASASRPEAATRSASTTSRSPDAERRASSTSGSSGERRASAGGGASERRASTPSSGTSERRASTPAASSGTTERRASSGRQHTVADGETLWGIARRYNTTVDTLRRANNLAADAQIKPGQRLAIPAAD